MRVLFIGGSGLISTDCVRAAIEKGHEVYVLNRGNRNDKLAEGARIITADTRDKRAVIAALGNLTFDCVADFISYTVGHVRQNISIYSGRTAQYIFISSASAYQKPLLNYPITESTPLNNPYWQYSRDKIACEDLLLAEYRGNGFPITIVRPSHTYADGAVPLAIHGAKGPWQVLARLLEGKAAPIFGEGATLWTVTHSRDFAAAFAHLLGNRKAVGDSFHITSDEALTWNQIYGCIARSLGMDFGQLKLISCPVWLLNAAGKEFGYDFTGPLTGDKANCAVFDNAKIKKLAPGWHAKTMFEEGVASSIAYIRNNERLRTPDLDFDRYCDKLEKIVESLGL